MDFIQILHLIKFIWESSMKVNFDSGDFNLAQENSLYWWYTTGYPEYIRAKESAVECMHLSTGHITTIFHVCFLPSLESLVDVSYLRKMNGDNGDLAWVSFLNKRPGAFFHQNCTLSNLPKIIRSTGVRTPHQNKSKGKCRG